MFPRGGSGDARQYDDLSNGHARQSNAFRSRRSLYWRELASVPAGHWRQLLAAPDAKLGVPAARLGLGYDVRGVARLHRVFGGGARNAMLLTAQPC